MGIQVSGAFGGFRNKTGPIVGRRVNGQNIVTGLHHPSNKPRTYLQLDQQQRFGLLSKLLNKITPLIQSGFKAFSKRRSTANTAYSYNYDRCFIVEEEGVFFHFPGLVYSRGNVATPNCVSVQLVEAEPGATYSFFAVFSWLPESESRYNRVTDRATFLIYNETRGLAYFKIGEVSRNELSFEMPVFRDMDGDQLHCYMSFASADGKSAGDSVYVGEL